MHKRAREQGATTTRIFPSLNLTLISGAPAMILFMLPMIADFVTFSF